MAKPFSIQSPEEIAKEYGGNKQKIAAAMQTGIVDPTAGVLAGMFIDRMRSAQMQEAAPQATVAQQVMGGALPAQPAAPAPAPIAPSPVGGLGAMPQAAPPMTPPMPQAPGFADGGDVNSYRLTPSPEYDRFRAEDVPAPKFEDLLRQFTGGGIHRKVGKGTARARYSPLDKRADYGVDYPIDDRTNVFAGASSNRGAIPTDFQIGVRHRFADGGFVGPYAAAGSANVGPQPQQIPGNQMAAPYTQGGGLSDVPIPDTMFDEPSNGGFGDGYSGGGLVAFASGGMSDLYDDVEYWESGGKQGAVSPKGARGVMQLMPGTMRDPGFGIAPMRDDSEAENRRVGREYLDAMYRKYGDRNTALMAYNWGPGNVDKWIKAGRPASMVPAETRKYVANIGKGSQPALPERDIGTTEGQLGNVEDIFGRLQDRFGRSEEEKAARSKLLARAQEMASDEGYEKQRKADMWQTLAEIGFNMASSKSPYLLQAVGEAASAAMPGARADKKERKAIKDRGLDLMVELGASDRKEAQQLWGMAVDAAKTGMQQKQFEKEYSLKERQIKNEKDYRDALVGIEDYKAKHPNASDLETKVGWVIQQKLAGDPVSAMQYLKDNGLIGGTGATGPGGTTADQIRAMEAGRGAGGSQAVKRAKDVNGKPIVFLNGQWVYE